MRLNRIEKLIALTAKGDRTAFDRLYDGTSAKLFGVTLHILKERPLAEEALQETYVKIWTQASRYRRKNLSPMTWMITLARNTAVDRLRRNKGRLSEPDLAQDVAAAGEDTTFDRRGAVATAKLLLPCLGRLEKDRAAALRAAYLDGASYADLSLRFDVPLNTMRDWMQRSVQVLRDCMRK
ncbi:MAG: sigma-70 family RNA polymerase sigma factor [Pseudomonadota bacterium]